MILQFVASIAVPVRTGTKPNIFEKLILFFSTVRSFLHPNIHMSIVLGM